MSEGVQTGGQLDLLPPGESDTALFLEPSDLRKRYTAKQALEVEGKRELIFLCIAAGYPLELVAEKARVNYRTVEALAARDAEKVAGDLKRFGREVRGLSARWYGLARTKEHEATFIQLAQAASFAAQRSNEIEIIAGMGEVGEKESAIASAGPDPCARLRQLLAPKAPGGSDATSGGSDPQQPADEHPLEDDVVRDAGGTVPTPGGDQGEAVDPAQPAGGRGGAETSGSTENLDTSERLRNFGKDDPS